MPDTVTLGVAIAIPEPHATVLTNWRRQVGDPAADLIWPHVTLLPPTPVPVAAMDDIHAHLHATAVENEPFLMHLSGTGTFRPTSPVVFIQIARGCRTASCSRRRFAAGHWIADWNFRITHTSPSRRRSGTADWTRRTRGCPDSSRDFR